MKKEWYVLLVEDDAKRGAQLESALRRKLAGRFGVQRLNTDVDGTKRAYEDRLLEALRRENIALIVSDRDLSAMKNYPGLSEAPVSKVARQLHIPVCVYASGKTDSFIERQRSGGGGRILLNSLDLKAMVHKVSVIADGFRELHDRVRSIDASEKERSKYRGPATVLAHLLKAPEVIDHLALYTRGDQRMIAELMPPQPDDVAGARTRGIALAFGVWLYDSVLRFPGIVLDVVAAASFLGIDPKAFRKPEVNKPFVKARYAGPFSDPQEPRWWRHRLVDIMETLGVPDGRALVKDATGRAPSPCRCSVDNRAPAGFVCVMTGEPVCDEHSVAEVGWLPRGADLARVRRDVFDRIGPWIGMV